MPSAAVQTLLGLSPDGPRPGPYAVFGLRTGEGDRQVIDQAISRTVAELNAAKSQSDPAAWKQAASLVSRARLILLDPQRKAKFDEAVRAEAKNRDAPKPPATNRPPMDDPLADLLPGGKGGDKQPQPVETQATPPASGPLFRAGKSPVRDQPPAPVASAPAVGAAAAVADHSPPSVPSSQDTAAPAMPFAVEQPPPLRRRRRRGFPWAAVILTSFVLLSIAGIAGLAYVLVNRPEGIAVNQLADGGDVAGGNAASPEETTPRAGAPRARRPPPDPVMGRLGPPKTDDAADSGRDDPERLRAADDWLKDLDGEAASENDRDMSASTAAAENDARDDPPSASGNSGDRSPAREAPRGSPEAVAAADGAIDKAKQSIAEADWDAMQAAAETARKAAATAEQKESAEGLMQLAELATYYHGAVDRGLDQLGAGKSFDVTEQLHIVIVEVTPEKVIVRFSGRNKEYARSELPLILVDKIAEFALDPSTPEAKAGRLAYRAIAPVTTAAYREEAASELEAMDEPVEGADPKKIAAAIRDIFTQ